MTIYVIEIPHRGTPICWTARDRDDLTTRVARSAERSDANITDYESAVEWLGHDLRGLLVFEGEAEARDALTRPFWAAGGRDELLAALDDAA